MMRRLGLKSCLLMFAGACAFTPGPVLAQAPGLGGYGASSSMAPAGMSSSGPIIPYGGSMSGFMPSRMGGGGTGLSFSSRNRSMVGAARSSFQLSTIGREMSMPSGRSGQSFGSGRAGMGGSRSPIGLGGGMNRAMEMGRESVMPPSFGYPFYQPGSLLGPSSAFMGMSSM
jgi:hypothetical protein